MACTPVPSLMRGSSLGVDVPLASRALAGASGGRNARRDAAGGLSGCAARACCPQEVCLGRSTRKVAGGPSGRSGRDGGRQLVNASGACCCGPGSGGQTHSPKAQGHAGPFKLPGVPADFW